MLDWWDNDGREGGGCIQNEKAIPKAPVATPLGGVAGGEACLIMESASRIATQFWMHSGSGEVKKAIVLLELQEIVLRKRQSSTGWWAAEALKR